MTDDPRQPMADERHERLAIARQHLDRELAGLVEMMPTTFGADDLGVVFAEPVLRARALGAVHRLDDVELIELVLLAAFWYGERGE